MKFAILTAKKYIVAHLSIDICVLHNFSFLLIYTYVGFTIQLFGEKVKKKNLQKWTKNDTFRCVYPTRSYQSSMKLGTEVHLITHSLRTKPVKNRITLKYSKVHFLGEMKFEHLNVLKKMSTFYQNDPEYRSFPSMYKYLGTIRVLKKLEKSMLRNDIFGQLPTSLQILVTMLVKVIICHIIKKSLTMTGCDGFKRCLAPVEEFLEGQITS